MKRRLLIMFLLGCLLPFAVQAQHGTFRFAQITDIHFSPNNPNPTEDLLRSVAQINATDSIDFVLVTGDITEEGDRHKGRTHPRRENSGVQKSPWGVLRVKEND